MRQASLSSVLGHHLWSRTESQPEFEKLTRIPLMSQEVFRLVILVALNGFRSL